MKTKVEIEGYEIEIECEGGVISVKAERDDEVVEEFSIQVEEAQEAQEGEEGAEEIQGFEDFEGEDDFEGEEFAGEEGFEGEEFAEEEDEAQGPALESFQSFINKRK